ncbi:MAG: nickel-dependent hydrogenase large subunit, partial [Acidobacteriota bacterium]
AVSRINIALWRAAQGARARGHVFHGYRTIADIMRGMNPIFGHLYRESLHLTRVAGEIATLLFGKYPHPSAIFPAGVGIVANRELYQQVLGRFNRLLDYAKKVTAIWDDLASFFVESEERFGESGGWAGGLLSLGLWDDPQAVDAPTSNAGEWGARRYATPGLMIGGELQTSNLAAIQSFLETEGRPHLESGPLARLWTTALSGKMRNEFIECQQRDHRPSLMFDLPKFQIPATFLAWQAPSRATTFERNRARAYQIAYASLVGLTYLLRSFESLARGGKAMSTRYRIPEEGRGTGLWEEPSGSIIHQLVIEGRRLRSYRVDAPETWLQAASDSPRRLGAIEQALINTPLVEEFSGPETFTGIDLLRVVRGFDC